MLAVFSKSRSLGSQAALVALACTISLFSTATQPIIFARPRASITASGVSPAPKEYQSQRNGGRRFLIELGWEVTLYLPRGSGLPRALFEVGSGNEISSQVCAYSGVRSAQAARSPPCE